MNTLVVLDYITTSVLFIRIDEEMAKALEEEYENDSMAWLEESGLEEKFGFSVSNSNWMLCDGVPEMFYCYPWKKGNEKVQMFPCM